MNESTFRSPAVREHLALMPILLKIIKGTGEGKILTVPDGRAFTLGRGTDASYLIPDPLLSREHCALHSDADGCTVVDLKSLNGTFLNGKRMIDTRALTPGDRLRVGSVVFEVLEATGARVPAPVDTFPPRASASAANPLAPPTALDEGAIPPTAIVPSPTAHPVAPHPPAHPAPPVTPAVTDEPGFPRTIFIANPPAFAALSAAAVSPAPPPPEDFPRTIVVPAPAPPPPADFPPTIIVHAPAPPPPPPADFPPTIIVQAPAPSPAGMAATRTCEACSTLLAQDEERSMCPACFDRFDVKEDLLEGFKILERVFRTPTGTVYKAEQPLLGRTVLVKTITTTGWEQDEKTIRRFLREAKAAARLTHPSIVEFYDVNEQGEHLFIVMEHVDGPSLEQTVNKSGPLDALRAARHMSQIADALAFVHAQRVVHRDVRPGTILIGRDGNAKLCDFTLARNVEIPAFGEITATGDVLAGIPYFDAPEQIRDTKRADARSDIYSFGATFFFALSGRRPIGGANYIEFLSRLAVESAPPLTSVAPGVPEALARVVDRCLRREQAARYQTMDEVQELLVPIARSLGAVD